MSDSPAAAGDEPGRQPGLQPRDAAGTATAVDRADPMTWVGGSPPRPIRRVEGEDPTDFFPSARRFNLPDTTRPLPRAQPGLLRAAAAGPVTGPAAAAKFRELFSQLDLNFDSSNNGEAAGGLDRLMRRAGARSRPPPVWCKPASGRTIHIKEGRLQLGLTALNRLVMVEKLPQIKRRQVFHERPGLKKKRLRSQRYCQRFKHAFVATVQRVQEMTRQGW